MSAGDQALAPFPAPHSLLEYLRPPIGLQDAKNRVLLALLTGLRRDKDVASTLLTLGLWPGLDHAYRALCHGFRGDREAVGHELIGAFMETMLKAKPERITRVAATLVCNAKRDATRALTKHKQFAEWLDPEIERRVPPVYGFLRQ